MSTKPVIHIINGPNINLLGGREPEIYGHLSYEALIAMAVKHGDERGFCIDCFQSNHEGELIDYLQKFTAPDNGDFFIINPGGLTHTSVSLRDTMTLLRSRIIEVHLSHLFHRESFRQKLVTTPASCGIISGLGHQGYLLAIDYFINSSQDE